MNDFVNDIVKIILRLRKSAAFWEWPDKSAKELEILKKLLNSMERDGIRHYRNPRSLKDNWPDCTIENEFGNSIAVEVTELVDEEVIQRCQRGEAVYRLWTDENIVDEVKKRMIKKDRKSFHGNLYSKVILLIHTDEFELIASRLFPALDKGKFPILRNIEEVFVICSYDPETKNYPYHQIQFGT
jgi:SAM-dependent MidA family methyltransferase